MTSERLEVCFGDVMKKLTTLSLVVLTTFVLAQQGGPRPRFIAHGKGVAQSEDGRRAEFQFEVAKAVNGEQSRVRGMSKFTQVRGENTPPVHIIVRNARNLVVNEHVAEFGGPAILEAPPATAGGQPRRLEGHAAFRVEDRKLPDGGADQPKDLYRVHFVSANNEVTFDFAGVVGRGDLVVKTNPGN